MASIVLPAFKQAYRTALTYNGDDVTVEDEPGILRAEVDNTYTVAGTLDGGIKIYRFVEVAATSSALTNGAVVTFSDVYGSKVTDDISESNVNLPAGVAIGAIAVGSKGWIQVYGYHSAVDTDGGDDIAIGDALIVDPTVDGTCDSVAIGTAPTHKTIGFANTADIDGSNTVAAFLNCL